MIAGPSLVVTQVAQVLVADTRWRGKQLLSCPAANRPKLQSCLHYALGGQKGLVEPIWAPSHTLRDSNVQLLLTPSTYPRIPQNDRSTALNIWI